MKRTELVRKTPMKRSREARGKSIAATLSFLRPIGQKEIAVLRSEKHRKNVASLDCVVCGKSGPSQCAHINFSKAMGMKACDSVTFPACVRCHSMHDQGGVPKAERRQLEWEYVDKTRAELLARNLWPASVEMYYQAAIEPLKRVAEQ